MNDTEQKRLVETSYRWCRDTAARSGSSFYRSFGLLDPSARNAMFALYAFARITDDIGDGDGSIDSKRARLRCMRASLSRRSESPEAETATLVHLWPAVHDAIDRYAIPISLLEEIIDGVEFDLRPVRIENTAQLDRYCYQVASAVGLACTHIWQARPDLSRQAAIDCGLAFQFTNIVRDVREDAARGRIYVPLDLLAHHTCSPDAWLAGRPDGDWKGAVRSLIQRAHQLYDSGFRTIEALPPRGADMFSLMWHSYRRLLDVVEADMDQLWSGRRTTLGKRDRIALVIKHYSPLRKWFRSRG